MRWRQNLSFLWLEFWLPLPLLGILFWLGGNAATEYLLSRPYTSANKLQTDPPTSVNFSSDNLSIAATIDKFKGLTKVKVISFDLAVKEVEFEFPVTEFGQVETAIAQKLGLTRAEIRKLTSYEIISAAEKKHQRRHKKRGKERSLFDNL
jgi:hypothetical protein